MCREYLEWINRITIIVDVVCTTSNLFCINLRSLNAEVLNGSLLLRVNLNHWVFRELPVSDINCHIFLFFQWNLEIVDEEQSERLTQLIDSESGCVENYNEGIVLSMKDADLEDVVKLIH